MDFKFWLIATCIDTEQEYGPWPLAVELVAATGPANCVPVATNNQWAQQTNWMQSLVIRNFA